jgi:hypothetical protein
MAVTGGFALVWHSCEFCGNVTIFPPGAGPECLFCSNRVIDCGGFKIRVRDDLASGLT